MNAWLRFRRRRWVRRYALTVVRHTGIRWDDALALANDSLRCAPWQLAKGDTTDPRIAAFDDLGITEADLV
ncbi:hypothetical protein [Chromohalobacter israelensis]|uniref:hypothetical protein n=1 Tax=Chromohalobacter israelensis TaxID=141390 RepID=UPI000FFEFDB0|nr:hypothetical protein [Chromohalobacter salexigens]RXE48731.1 hypothetical protein B4O83_12430 [Chromohalobacter salexigens]